MMVHVQLNKGFEMRFTRIVVAAVAAGSILASCNTQGPSSEEMTFRGDVYLNLKNIDKAKDYATKAIAADDKNAEAYMLMARVWATANNADSVTAFYVKATEAQPENLDALYALSNVYAVRKDYDKALASIDKAIALKPDSALGYNNQGVIYTSKGEFDKAIVAFKKALEKQAVYPEVHYNLGNTYVKKGDCSSALPEFKKSLEQNPNFAQSYFEIAACEAQRGNNAEAYNQNGLGFTVQNNVQSAAAAFMKAIELNPGFAVAHNNLAHMYLRANQRDKAIEEFKKAAGLGHSDAQRLLASENISWTK